VTGSGSLPIVEDNDTIFCESFKILSINGEIAVVEKEPFYVGDLPYSVIHGAGIYHNRDGSFFAGVQS
jgi:hypothetical protein